MLSADHASTLLAWNPLGSELECRVMQQGRQDGYGEILSSMQTTGCSHLGNAAERKWKLDRHEEWLFMSYLMSRSSMRMMIRVSLSILAYLLTSPCASRFIPNGHQCEEHRRRDNNPSWNHHLESRHRTSILDLDLVEVSDMSLLVLVRALFEGHSPLRKNEVTGSRL